jgi:hypothetical protein
LKCFIVPTNHITGNWTNHKSLFPAEKTTNWYFKTLDFKRREFWKSTVKKLREKKYGKKSTGKKVREKKYGKKKYEKKIREKIRQKLVQTWNTMKRCKSRHLLIVTISNIYLTSDYDISFLTLSVYPPLSIRDVHGEVKSIQHYQ